MQPREALLEIKKFGGILRVSAVDSASLTEVIFQAPASAGQEQIRRLAMAKLAYVMRKAGKNT